MRTITVAAYRRPEYLKQVLDSLTTALMYCPEYRPTITIGIDPGANEFQEVCRVALDFEKATPGTSVIAWPKHLGVDEHPRRLLQHAFWEQKSPYNLHLEDDTLLSPDALRLALWFDKEGRYDVLSLCHPSYECSRPGIIEKIPGFSCWGWACSDRVWRILTLGWNYRREQPLGWDWSMTDVINQCGLQSVAPVLSRVKNIGRERGEYQTPTQHDHDFEGQVQAGLEHMQRVDQFRLEKK